MAMKNRCLIIALTMVVAACGSPHWITATYDQFPVNRGLVKRGEQPFRVIALIPGGGDVADAVGVELTKRGFQTVAPVSTTSMVSGVDFKAVSEHRIPARRNPGEIDKLRQQLGARGVDLFMVFHVTDFEPRQWREHKFWQQADYMMFSTRHTGPGYFGDIASGRWANIDNRAKSPADAAVEIVNSMAMGGGAI